MLFHVENLKKKVQAASWASKEGMYSSLRGTILNRALKEVEHRKVSKI